MSTETDTETVDFGREASVSVEDLIRGFLGTHRFLHQYRIQKLIYLAELMYSEKHEKPLTKSQYKPYMYGAYSEDVDDVLSNMKRDPSVESESQYRYGDRKTTYKSSSVDPDLDSEVEELVRIVTDLTRSMSSDEIAEWSKSTYLFDETDYDERMEFRDYVHAIKNGEIEPDWKNLAE